MRELLVEPDRPAAGGELETGLRYYVLVDELELGQGMLCESYGVKVTAPDGDEASVRNITVGRSASTACWSCSSATRCRRWPCGM